MSETTTATETRSYRIVRYYFNGPRPKTILRGLTLAQAQEHCADPNTSSKTAWTTSARARTRRYGQWFDGYTQE